MSAEPLPVVRTRTRPHAVTILRPDYDHAAGPWPEEAPQLAVAVHHGDDDDPSRRIGLFDEQGGPWPYAQRLLGDLTADEARQLARLLTAAADEIDPPESGAPPT